MSLPNEPIPDQPPLPAPGWKPVPPIKEPDPDRLPDETPLPNPDENEEPRKHVGSVRVSLRRAEPDHQGRSSVSRQI